MPPTDLPAILGNRAAPFHRPTSNRHRWFALGVGILVAVFALLTWRRWIPATTVQVARVEAIRADDGGAVTSAGTERIAFQAAGWIEADPFLIQVSALIDGTVAEVPVVAGQSVEAGTIIARLVDDDQRLAQEATRAALARAEADLILARARLAEAQAEAARLPARIAAATALRDERRDRSERLAGSGDAVPLGEARQAALQTEDAEHHLADLRGSDAVLAATVQAAHAEVDRAGALVTEARVAQAQADLAQERTVIRAPQAGTIQRLHVRPGAKLMLGGDMPGSATAAELFDPANLQVRVDVSLADVSGLRVGQAARITCEALGQRTLAGEVTRIDGMADLARNTLQAKVRLQEGDPLLRPEMLCRVQFLGQRDGGGTASSAGRVRLVLAENSVPGGASGEIQIWTVDADQRARRATIRLGGRHDGLVEVTEGLTAGAWVIIDPPADLSDGDRVATENQP